ncbi:MAG: hypothetical protein L3J35_12535 [Bacteroidales bacterium]|nr:hypothetical protein [Bacteroidales bacterium]
MNFIGITILFAVNSGLLMLFALIGHLIFSLFNNKEKVRRKNIGYEIIFGFFVAIIVYSFVKAGYKTINILFIELAILYLFLQRKSFSLKSIEIKSFIPKIKYILPYIFILFLFSLFQWLKEYDGGNIHLYYRDYNYYVSVAETFNSFNNEACNLWYTIFNEGSESIKIPYHNFDIWVNSFLLNFSNIPSVFVFVYQFIPLVAVLSAVSFSQMFINVFKQKNFKSVIFASLLIVLGGILPFKGGFSTNVFFYPKFIAAFLLFPFVAISLYKKDYVLLVLLACVTVILHPVYIFTVFGALGIFFLFLFIKERKKQYIGMIIVLIIFLLIYFLYYNIWGGEKDVGLSFDNYFTKSYFSTFLKKMFVDYLFRLPIYYFSLTVAFLMFIFSKRLKILFSAPVIVFLLISLLGIIFTSGIINRESFAIVTSVLNTSLLIISVIVLGKVFNSLQAKKNLYNNYIIIFAVFLQVIFSWLYTFNNTEFREISISKPFYNKIKKNDLSELGCYFVAEGRFLNSTFGNPHVPIIGGINHIIQRNTYLVSLSVYNKRNDKNIQQIIKNTPFYRFVEVQKNNNQFENLEKSQVEFIKKYHINFAVFEADCPYPECLKSFNCVSISDSLSGITFVYIKNH